MSTDADTITDEQVAAIADRMVEEGKRVSPVTIWSEVRGGSLVAIVAALQRWREAREDKTLELQLQTGLPGSLAETVMSAAGRIWTASQETAEQAFNQRLTVMGQHLESAFADRDEAHAEYQKTFEEAEAQRERLDALTNALSAAEQTAAQLGSELAAATSRAEAAETRVEELAQRVSIDEASLEATRISLDEERAAREELASVVASKTDEIAQITQERDYARQEVATLGEACQAKSHEAERWSQESNVATARAESAEARIEELVQQASVDTANLEATKASLDEERKACEDLVVVVSSKSDDIARLTQERDDARQEIAALSDTCQAKSDEVDRLLAESSAASWRAQGAEARIEELVQRASVEEANLELTRTSLEEERQAREALAAAVASKSDEITQIAQERDEARQEATTLSNACQAKSDEVNRLLNESSSLAWRAQAAETRIEELVQRASVEEANLAATTTTLEEERRAHEELAAVVLGKNDEIARISQEYDAQRQEVATLRDTCQTQSGELNRLLQESGSLTSRAQAAEARVEELTQRVSVEEGNLEATKASLEEERGTRDELTAVIAGKNDEIARINQEYETARQEVATLSAASQAKYDEANRLSDELSATSSRVDAATTQANESFARLAALEMELNEARAALAAERESAAARIDGASAQIDELRRITDELDETRKQVSALSEAKTATGAELDRLSQDASAARERAEAAEQHAAELEQRLAEQADAVAKDDQPGGPAGTPSDGTESADDVVTLQRQISAQAKAHAKALSELRTNAEQWVAHAKELRQRLGQASEKILFIDARSTGEVALVRRLASELERVKPDHELIARDAQQRLIGATMAQQLAQKGYRYDPSTAVMSKVEG
jgi:chromosome segregation ATPase